MSELYEDNPDMVPFEIHGYPGFDLSLPSQHNLTAEVDTFSDFPCGRVTCEVADRHAFRTHHDLFVRVAAGGRQ